MTPPDPKVLDLNRIGRLPTSTAAEGRDLRVLRRVFDLQLDAMLLSLGAAAQSERRDDPGGVPWQRWLREDLELARTLAAALVDKDGGPPASRGGGDLAQRDDGTCLDTLVARFENIEDLLLDILERPAPPTAWRGAAAEALQRCRARLSELHHHRRDAMSGFDVVTVPSVPGEWLG